MQTLADIVLSLCVTNQFRQKFLPLLGWLRVLGGTTSSTPGACTTHLLDLVNVNPYLENCPTQAKL